MKNTKQRVSIPEKRLVRDRSLFALRHLVLILIIALSFLCSACDRSRPTTALSTAKSTTVNPNSTTRLTSSQTTEPKLNKYSTTTTRTLDGGYTCQYTLSVWDPYLKISGDSVQHPDSSSVTTSQFKPKTDIVIPGSLEITNTTQNFDMEKMSAGFEMTGSVVKSQSVSDFILKSNFYPTLTYKLSSGQEKTFSYNRAFIDGNLSFMRGVVNDSPIVVWSPFPSGKTVRLNFFLIINNYYSPNYPDGNKELLDYLNLRLLNLANTYKISFSGKH